MNQDELLNLQSVDPFADAAAEDDVDKLQGNTDQQIHLRCQQRNGRKCITTVQGLSESLDLKRLIKTFKRTFSCNGAIKTDKDTDGKIIQMSGDQRHGVRKFLTDHEIVTENSIILHGA
jgi:translation initiation factor 1